MNREFPDVQAGFRKGRGTRDQIVNILLIIEKQESSRKTSISALKTIPKPLTVWITGNSGKLFKSSEYQTTWRVTWEICMQVRKQQLEPDMEQQTASKEGKEYLKDAYCHPFYLTYMQSTSWEMLGWMKHKLKSSMPGEILSTSDMQMIPPLWQKTKNSRASWLKWKRRAQHS